MPPSVVGQTSSSQQQQEEEERQQQELIAHSMTSSAPPQVKHASIRTFFSPLRASWCMLEFFSPPLPSPPPLDYSIPYIIREIAVCARVCGASQGKKKRKEKKYEREGEGGEVPYGMIYFSSSSSSFLPSFLPFVGITNANRLSPTSGQERKRNSPPRLPL